MAKSVRPPLVWLTRVMIVVALINWSWLAVHAATTTEPVNAQPLWVSIACLVIGVIVGTAMWSLGEAKRSRRMADQHAPQAEVKPTVMLIMIMAGLMGSTLRNVVTGSIDVWAWAGLGLISTSSGMILCLALLGVLDDLRRSVNRATQLSDDRLLGVSDQA